MRRIESPGCSRAARGCHCPVRAWSMRCALSPGRPDPHGERGEGEHLWHHGDAPGLAERLLTLGQPERVDGAQHQRTQRPDASSDTGDQVAELPVLRRILAAGVARHRVGEHIVPEPAGDADRAQREAHGHAGRLGHRQQIGGDLPRDGAGSSGQPDGEEGEERDRRQQHAEVQQDAGAQQVRGDHAAERGDERSGAATGEGSSSSHDRCVRNGSRRVRAPARRSG